MKAKNLLLGWCTLLLLSFLNPIFGQDWRIEKTLTVNDSLSVVSLRYTATDQGVAAIDEAGRMKWEIHIPGLILGLGKRVNNDLIAFYTMEYKDQFYKRIKDIHALAIGVKQGKILSDKVVYSNDSKNYVVPSLVNDPAGYFSTLLVRASGTERILEQFEQFNHNKKSDILSLTAISVGSDLKASSKEIPTLAVGNTFIGACSGLQKEFYILGVVEGELVAEKFDPDWKLISKLTTTFSYKNESLYWGATNFDSQGDAIDLSLQYENGEKKRAISSYRIDFNKGKIVFTPETLLNKEYINEIKEGQRDKLRSWDLSKIEDLRPVGIVETADRIIVFKEIQYAGRGNGRDSPMHYGMDDAIISVYSKDLKLLNSLVINKTSETYFAATNGLGYLLKEGKLYIATTELTGIGSYTDDLYTLDPESGSMQKKTVDRKGLVRILYFNSPNTLWFRHNYVAPIESGMSFFKTRFNTNLVVQPYE